MADDQTTRGKPEYPWGSFLPDDGEDTTDGEDTAPLDQESLEKELAEVRAKGQWLESALRDQAIQTLTKRIHEIDYDLAVLRHQMYAIFANRFDVNRSSFNLGIDDALTMPLLNHISISDVESSLISLRALKELADTQVASLLAIQLNYKLWHFSRPTRSGTPHYFIQKEDDAEDNEMKKALAADINETIKSWGMAIEHPKSFNECSLYVTGSVDKKGRYTLENRSTKKRSHTSRSIAELMPIRLVPDRPSRSSGTRTSNINEFFRINIPMD